jgi:two-component system response regulator AtoC
LIPVNCGAIPDTLLESEFFGHLKGAFTGADRAKKGLFLEADKGTLFLDEIGELPVALQVKLLHAIEDGEIRPVGAGKGRRADVRILAATNRDLREMVRRGEFREDLYYRLNVVHIHIPPLSERREDIPRLVDFMLRREARRMGIDRDVSMDPAAMEVLRVHDWPGNARELQNAVARALILAEADRITVGDLPPQLSTGTAGAALGSSPSETGESLKDQVRRFEVSVIHDAISHAGGDRQRAAQQLGIGLSTLYRKLEEGERPLRAQAAAE